MSSPRFDVVLGAGRGHRDGARNLSDKEVVGMFAAGLDATGTSLRSRCATAPGPGSLTTRLCALLADDELLAWRCAAHTTTMRVRKHPAVAELLNAGSALPHGAGIVAGTNKGEAALIAQLAQTGQDRAGLAHIGVRPIDELLSLIRLRARPLRMLSELGAATEPVRLHIELPVLMGDRHLVAKTEQTFGALHRGGLATAAAGDEFAVSLTADGRRLLELPGT